MVEGRRGGGGLEVVLPEGMSCLGEGLEIGGNYVLKEPPSKYLRGSFSSTMIFRINKRHCFAPNFQNILSCTNLHLVKCDAA